MSFPKELFEGIVQGNLPLVKKALDKGEDVNCKNVLGNSPLHCACIKNNPDIVKELIYRGAEIDSVECLGETPLMWACQDKNIKIIDILLDAGADPIRKNFLGKSSIDILVDKNCENGIILCYEKHAMNTSSSVKPSSRKK